jgi:hypothetical protein
MTTVSQIQELLVTTLVRQAGGPPRRWRSAIGAIRLHDRATHPHCNWSVHPSGSPRDVAAVEKLLDTIRLSHPIVLPD